ncbi:MAG: nucleotidyl transferase AbiEii/AbiGii toxin family protein [Candidatus Micrarchaeota archaeon]|nr:nucleotidyl transferase AbiEii/AbiGii toxin family protein [Candidatus Micrarchaeota archaeon]MDE1848088.1 nucleotidyl transferase AbiEii/AbiGii toxin family protein [Candidatus Micrarchaeota archaeon]MDE1864935.1 nucleotidyl transferase AbiEii/AbiGii toxin family protein [Candidatus Micrarchaeota archaeon]
MIDKKELIEIARLMGLKPWQQEKHYIQYLALNSIAEEPLVFKGGTYLWFASGLDRFSEDLDFTASELLSHDVAAKVSKNLSFFGVENTIKPITNNEATLSFRISAKGPLNTAKIDECTVYVEISKREQILKKTLPIRLDYPPYSLPIKTISGMALEEVGAEKVRAMLTREKARDVYDLYHLVSKNGIRFDENMINSKLEYYSLEFSPKGFLKSILDHQTYYAKELTNLVFGELPKFDKVKEALLNWVGA